MLCRSSEYGTTVTALGFIITRVICRDDRKKGELKLSMIAKTKKVGKRNIVIDEDKSEYSDCYEEEEFIVAGKTLGSESDDFQL